MRSKRSNNRLNLSSHAKVRSTCIRKAWIIALNNRLRPRLGRLRLRGFSLMLGIMPALNMHVRFALESKPPSRLTEAPLRSNPTSLATRFNAFRPLGNSTISVSCTGATGTGANTEPWLSVMAMTFSPFRACGPSSPCHRPLFGHGIGPVAMEHAEIELLLGREMPHTGHKRLPQRPIIRPSGKDFVDGRIVNGRLALGVLRHGQTLPLHPGVKHPQDKVEDAVIAQFALRTAPGHREVR